MIKLNGTEIKPTIFSDKTSQVWKLPEGCLNGKQFNIVFEFENEGEIFQLQQLVSLIRHGNIPREFNLHMPFLPYGRQDKEISNESTFAFRIFASVLNYMCFDKVTTLDAHSNLGEEIITNFESIYPEAEIQLAVLETGCDRGYF